MAFMLMRMPPANRDLAPTVSSSERKQVLFPDLQRLRHKDDLGIRHASDLRFNLGDRVLADVPAGTRTARGQHRLCPTFAVADFSHRRTDNVLRTRFAHSFALTVCDFGLGFLPISEEAGPGI